MKLSIKQIQIPMRSSFKHASAERSTTDSVWAEITEGTITGIGEGCPRPYVTGENSSSAIQWVLSIQNEIESKIKSLNDLRDWINNNTPAIDKNPAAWCAVEIACLDFLAQKENCTIEKLIGVEDSHQKFAYTAVVSDENGEKLQGLLAQYMKFGFTDFKFKLAGDLELDQAKFQTLYTMAEKAGLPKPRVRVDANNLWPQAPEKAIAYLKELQIPYFGIEEPLSPKEVKNLSRLSQELNSAVILDESVCSPNDFELFRDAPGTWIPNIRVSKAGGILRALELAHKVKACGWKAIVGAQVGETSILTRAALIVAKELQENLAAQEGAYGTILLESDPAEPVLQFGARGIMEFPPPSIHSSGHGLRKV